jgi:hypothetical protein
LGVEPVDDLRTGKDAASLGDGDVRCTPTAPYQLAVARCDAAIGGLEQVEIEK